MGYSEMTLVSELKHKICVIPTADVRDKPGREKDSKCGIATSKGELKDEYNHYIQQMFQEIKEYFSQIS